MNQGSERVSHDRQNTRPAADAGFYKGHGLGNDYLVFEEGDAWPVGAAAVGAVCHRWEGTGGDGVVVLLRGEDEPWRLRMFNPDGSEFERSGNGLRILASYLHRTGRVAEEPFQVHVGGDTIGMRVHGVDRGEYDVSVQMGRARTGAAAVALDPDALNEAGHLCLDRTEPLDAVFVSVGNPHCVVWGDPEAFASLERAALDRIGPRVAPHRAFANGVNVQLARVLDDHTLEALVWERGVGHTAASGTSACAVAVSAVASGRMEAGAKTVRMEGGSLKVTVREALEVELRGAVQAVCDGVLDPGFAARLTSGV